MRDTELLLEELEGLKNLASRSYGDRLRKARSRGMAPTEGKEEEMGELPNLCESCKEELPEGAAFCPKCGAPVAGEEGEGEGALVEGMMGGE